jgi:hypothetical protein
MTGRSGAEQEMIMAGLIIAGILALNIFGLVAYLRRQRIEKSRLQRVRAAEWKHQANEETRRLARERARIAYPELLDAREADRDPIGPFGGYETEDVGRIRAARALIEDEIERVPKNERAALEDELSTLWCAVDYSNRAFDIPKNGEPSKHLHGPVRIIDCGEAGKIELFTPKQVEAARDESGRTRYIAFLKRCYHAPDVARRAIARTKARDEAIERGRREAEAAITTKIDDLPTLPKSGRQP